ncbi:MAG: hypothetical protein IKR61_04570 [Lachnospiraceae bacterium]|nr:hypothetical protein [Lachnospiraceae bacterium]
MENMKYSYLNAPPLMKGVNGFFDFTFLEKGRGKRDAKHHQLCRLGEGHTTPYIDSKLHACNSYIDDVYLRTAQCLEPTVKEATKLVVELRLLNGPERKAAPTTNREEEQRRKAAEAGRRAQNAKRRKEILLRMAEIHAETELVDEMLTHHIERAEGVLHSRLSRYWRGVLAKAQEDLDHFPYLEPQDSKGRQKYLAHKENLDEQIRRVLEIGGEEDEDPGETEGQMGA